MVNQENNTKTVPTITPSSTLVTITNLQDGNIISLTNGTFVKPQPNENEHSPPKRDLVVSGTVSGAEKVMVSGTVSGAEKVSVKEKQATINKGSWSVELPISELGRFEITATAGTKKHTITVHIFSISIVQPTENQKFEISPSISPSLAMPTIQAKARIDGHPKADITSSMKFSWKFIIGGFYRTRIENKRNSGHWEKYEETFIKKDGSYVWTPSLPKIVGGWGKITVEAEVPSVDTNSKSDPCWIDIRGTNPEKSAVIEFIRQIGKDDTDTFINICCAESLDHEFQQFRPKGEEREDDDDRIPSNLRKVPLRPVFGKPPAGIGIAQCDPAVFPQQHWDWTANVTEGLRRYRNKKTRAKKWIRDEQDRIKNEWNLVKTEIKKQLAESEIDNRLLPVSVPDPVPDLTKEPHPVPDLTNEQLLRETIRLYNGGHQYRFDLHYVVDENGSNYQTKGKKIWKDDPGMWETVDEWKKHGGIKVCRIWNRVANENKNYVTDVEKCKESHPI